MDKKYIELIERLFRGHHMEKSELEDLKGYLQCHLINIEFRLKEV